MTNQIEIQNLKCGGCATTIKNGLDGIPGVSNTSVNQENALVSFDLENDSDLYKVNDKLREMGYPAVGEDNKILTKAKSYVSCAIGKVS